MSSLQARAEHLIERRVILALREAEAIARSNPDAIVLDMIGQTVWQGVERWDITAKGHRYRSGRVHRRGSKHFRFAAMLICSHGKLITRDDVHYCLWGDDPNGGPDNPDRIYHVLRCRFGDLFNWIGLKLERRPGLGLSPTLSQHRPLAQAA